MAKWIVILIYVLNKIFEGIIDYLNARYLDKELPDNVKDVYDQNEYEKYVSYENENGKVDEIENAIDIIIELVLLIFNLYAFIFDKLVINNPYLHYLIFIVVITILKYPVHMLASYYSTFVIEEKYGMNNTSKKTFILDELKSFLIAIQLQFLVMFIIMFCFIKFGKWAVFYVFGIALVITFSIAAILVPIMKIYNKYSPLQDGELRDKLLELCRKYDIKVREILVKDASRRTTIANASCLGLKEITITLDDNLINNFEDKEIVAVFAHELAHAKNRHALKRIPIAILKILVNTVVLGVFIYMPVIYQAFGFAEINYLFASQFAGIAIWPVNIVFDLISNKISRQHEYEADILATKEGYGIPLISCLKRLFKEDLSDINPHPAVVAVYNNHPTLSQRIEAIQRTMNKVGN